MNTRWCVGVPTHPTNWGEKFREDIWWRFEEFEGLNLGTTPAMPEGMRAIPEPAFGALALLALTAVLKRGRRRG